MHTLPLRARRARALALAVAATVAASVLAALPAPQADARASFQLGRLAGAGRVQTAAAVALDAFTSSDTALIVYKDDFPDGLAANYKAGVERAPILMSGSDSVPPSTMSVLDQLNVKTVFLIGGTSVLRPTVRAQLEAEGYDVEQIGGTNRYATAAAVATHDGADAVGTTAPEDLKSVFLTTGLKPWDAIAASPLSFDRMVPTLLTRPDELHPDADAAIDDLGIERVIILGGTSAVSQEVQDEIAAKEGVEVTRIEGTTRWETAAETANYAISSLGYSTEHVDIATGHEFADALTGGPNAGNRDTPSVLLLVGSVPQVVCDLLGTMTDTLADGHIFGGSAAVSAEDEAALETCGGASPPKEGVITAVDATNDNYRMSVDGTDESLLIGFNDSDRYFVDGGGASMAAFEGQLTVGDRIRWFKDATDSSPSGADEHFLENKAPSEYTEGMVGDVDTAANTLHIIDPTSGVVLSDTKAYGGASYTVDGTSRAVSFFENDLNEGDEISITGSGASATYHLTNQIVTGAVADIDTDADEVTIDGLGDDPTGAQDARFDYVTGASTNTYTIDGVSASLEQFEAALSGGDLVTYSREGNEQTFALEDAPPQGLLAAGTGQEPDLDGNNDASTDDADGGTVTLVNGAIDIAVTYSANAKFFVNGVLKVETEFEDELSAGDFVEYTPDNPGTPANEEQVEVQNRNLQGTLADVVTGLPDDDAAPGAEHYDVVNSAGNVIYNDLDYTESVFGGGDSYFTDGAQRQAVLLFEQDLNANNDGSATITVSGHPGSTRHDLTTS